MPAVLPRGRPASTNFLPHHPSSSLRPGIHTPPQPRPGYFRASNPGPRALPDTTGVARGYHHLAPPARLHRPWRWHLGSPFARTTEDLAPARGFDSPPQRPFGTACRPMPARLVLRSFSEVVCQRSQENGTTRAHTPAKAHCTLLTAHCQAGHQGGTVSIAYGSKSVPVTRHLQRRIALVILLEKGRPLCATRCQVETMKDFVCCLDVGTLGQHWMEFLADYCRWTTPFRSEAGSESSGEER